MSLPAAQVPSEPPARPGLPGMPMLARAFVPLLMITLPLEFTSQYFPLKVVQVSRIVIVLGFLWFGVELLHRQRKLAVPRVASFAWLSVLAAYAALSAILTRSHRPGDAITVLVYFAVMILVYNWTTVWDDHWRAWASLAFTGMVIGLSGLAMHLTNRYLWLRDTVSGFGRVNATFADPNILARFFALVAGPTTAILADRVRRWWRIALLGCVFSAALALPYTFSRAGWAVFFLTVLTAAILVRDRSWGLLALLLAAATFAVLLLVDPHVLHRSGQLIVNSPGPPPHLPGYLTFLLKLPLDAQRRYLVAAGLQMFVDHPLFGVGFGNYQHLLVTQYSTFLEKGYFDTLSHTTLATILAELGIVGFILTIGVVVLVLKEALGAARHGGRGYAFVIAPVLGISAIFVDSQITGRLFSEPYLWVFLGLLYAAGAAIRREPDRGR